MKIQIMRNYDTVEMVNARDLKQLIAAGEILAFRRADGWVKVGAEAVRGDGGKVYDGPERREIMQKPVSDEQKRNEHYCVVGVAGPESKW